MVVPKFKLEFDSDQITHYKSLIDDILTSPRPISNGKYVQEFENGFSALMSVVSSVAVGSGTDALEVALRTLDMKGKVIGLPSNTMIGTLLAVERAGGVPVLLDIDLSTYALSIKDLEEYRKELHAIILVHIGGTVSDNQRYIKEICEDNDIILIEDAAQAVGADYAGNVGDIACFSFSATKVMTTGEGGMVATNNEDYVEKMRSIRNFGSPPGESHIHTIPGGNFKMTEFQAALGITELERVESRIKKRRRLDVLYSSLEHPYNPRDMDDGSHFKQIVELYDIDRNHLKQYCSEHGIGLTGEVYPLGLHEQPVLHNRFNRKFPNTEWFCTNHICPPNYPELESSEVKYVCEVLREYAERYSGTRREEVHRED